MKKIYLSPSDQYYNEYAAGNTNEAEQCRKIATALVAALERCGFQAMTNITDEATMYDRVRESNAWNADMHIAIHTNAHNGQVKGTRLFCYDVTGEGYKACKAIMATLAPITPGESDSITVHHFYEVRDANAAVVYLEVAFHDNKEEAAWIIAHTQDIAEAVCRGVCDHYGVTYTDTKAQEPEPPEAPAQPQEPAILYRVQVGAFSKKANAERKLAAVKAAGFDAFVVCVDSKLWRVQVGAFAKRDNADRMLQRIQAAGFLGFVTKNGGTAETAPKVMEGSRVRVKKGAKTYTGGGLKSYVYENTYTVIELAGDRAVIGIGSVVTAAMHVDDLVLA